VVVGFRLELGRMGLGIRQYWRRVVFVSAVESSQPPGGAAWEITKTGQGRLGFHIYERAHSRSPIPPLCLAENQSPISTAIESGLRHV